MRLTIINTCFWMVPVFLAACGHEQKEYGGKVGGMYVVQYATEYSVGSDTIEISPLNRRVGSFHYTRRVRYRRIVKGVLGPPQFKTEVSTAIYKEHTAQLTEQGHGRVYSLSPDGDLVFGNNIYKRIRSLK